MWNLNATYLHHPPTLFSIILFVFLLHFIATASCLHTCSSGLERLVNTFKVKSNGIVQSISCGFELVERIRLHPDSFLLSASFISSIFTWPGYTEGNIWISIWIRRTTLHACWPKQWLCNKPHNILLSVLISPSLIAYLLNQYSLWASCLIWIP